MAISKAGYDYGESATVSTRLDLWILIRDTVLHRISEENFWRNYFYRVSVLRQSHELNTMANQAENNLNQTSAGTVDQAEGNSKQTLDKQFFITLFIIHIHRFSFYYYYFFFLNYRHRYYHSFDCHAIKCDTVVAQLFPRSTFFLLKVSLFKFETSSLSFSERKFHQVSLNETHPVVVLFFFFSLACSFSFPSPFLDGFFVVTGVSGVD